MKSILIFLFLVCINPILVGQVREKLLLKCTDSTLLKEYLPQFDDKGNFLFRFESDTGDFVITANDTIGPMFGYATGGMTSHYHPDEEKGKYYISDDLPFCFGPTTGANWSYFRRPESKNLMHEFVVFQENEAINIYFDGKLIKQIDTLSTSSVKVNNEYVNQLSNKKYNFDNNYWAFISNNGKSIYSLEENRIHNLYVNHQKVDSSLIGFYKPMINDHNDFIYYKTFKNGEGDSAKYFRYVYNKNTVIGPINKSLWENAILDNGGYFYLDSDDWNTLILINNKLYANLEKGKVKQILIPDNKHFLCIKEQDEKLLVYTSDTVFQLDFEHIYLPTINKKGDISMLVVDQFYLYRWTNGKLDTKPLTNYGVRPKPISLDAQGNAVVMYETNDSCYVYRNDVLKFKEAKNNVFYTDLKNMVFHYPNRDIYNNGQNHTYFAIKDSAYVISNSVFSQSFPAVKRNSHLSSRDAGPKEIVTGDILEDDYYFICKNDKDEFSIIVNGIIKEKIKGVDRIFEKSTIQGNTLIFYGIKNFSLYQFTISL